MTPDGWRQATVADIATLVSSGVTPKGGSAIYKTDGIPFLRSQNIHFGGLRLDDVAYIEPVMHASMARTHVRAGDVLLNITGASIGRCTTVPGHLGPANVNQHVCIIRCVPERADGSFIAHYLASDEGQREIDSRQAGLSREALNYEQVRALRVPLPPLPEQKKIAAILSSVDDAIEGTQAVINQLQVVKKAMMAELLTRGLPGRHTRFKQTETGEVPEEWVLCSIDDLGLPGEQVVRTGPFGSSMKTKDFRPNGVHVLTIQSLGEGEILHGGLFFVDEKKAAELAEYKVRLNDVVFSRVADIGRCAAISENEAGWLISPNLSRIRLDPRKADARFLMYLITMGDAVRRQVEMVAGNAGRPVITSTTLKELRLPLPSIEEQQAVTAAGRELETRIATEIYGLNALRVVKSALMSALLTGEVRVTPDKDLK